MKHRNIPMLALAFILIASSSMITPLSALLTKSVSISIAGTIRAQRIRRVALATGSAPPQDIIDKLRLEWTWGPFTFEGGDLTRLYSLLDAGIKHVITDVMDMEYGDHDWVMQCLRNNINPSVDHPEIYGVYFEDYLDNIVKYGRNKEQVLEIVNTIRSTNPNLKIIVPWNYWSVNYFPSLVDVDECLSWSDFDEVIVNYHMMPEHPLEQLDSFLTSAEAKFTGKKIWASAYVRAQDKTPMTEEDFKYVLSVLRDHYDAGKIAGIRLYGMDWMQTAGFQYVDYTAEEFV